MNHWVPQTTGNFLTATLTNRDVTHNEDEKSIELLAPATFALITREDFNNLTGFIKRRVQLITGTHMNHYKVIQLNPWRYCVVMLFCSALLTKFG